MKKKIICRVLTGPTGSGKSDFGLRYALENDLDLICMDSMQIYRGMDIGTAKPTPEERKKVPHHMIDICDPRDSYSVSDYCEEAGRIIRECWEKRKREVLFVGGTGLYLQALMHPMAMGSTPADPALRERLKNLSGEKGGREKLHGMLEEMDPATAARLPLNDVRRVIRAIEVTHATGIPFSEQKNPELSSEFEWRVAATAMDRPELYDRINRRVDRMIHAGLREEVEQLLASGVPPEAQSMSAIGYKEMIPCIRGEMPLEKAADLIRLNSRHYAKRQETFLRRESCIRYFDPLSPEAYDHLAGILHE